MANRHDPDQNVSETYVLFELREQLWQKHMRWETPTEMSRGGS